MKPYVVSIDPSGSFKEGLGTTGYYVLDGECNTVRHGIVEAKNHTDQMHYWNHVLCTIDSLMSINKNAVLSLEDYVLYASSAKSQINSEMETSKLIGAIMMHAYLHNYKLYKRNASAVMKRWTNHIIEHKGIIVRSGNTWADAQGNKINQHSMDALRHGLHCHYFESEDI